MDTQQVKEINKFNQQVALELTERFGFKVEYKYTRNQTARFIFDDNKFSFDIGNERIPFKKFPKILCYTELISIFKLDDKGDYQLLDREFKRNCISKMPVQTVYLTK